MAGVECITRRGDGIDCCVHRVGDFPAEIKGHNVPGLDHRTSSLTQSPASHSAMIELERFVGTPPRIKAHDPPIFGTKK